MQEKVDNLVCYKKIIEILPPFIVKHSKYVLATAGAAVFFLLPATSHAMTPYAPCANISGTTSTYQCRRLEAMKHVRELNTEFRINSASTIRAISEDYAVQMKNLYRTYEKLSSTERLVYVNELKDQRLATYLVWYAEEQDLIAARKNLRKLTRIPGNQALRLELIKERGELLDKTGNLKKTRRAIVDEQLEKLKTFRS